MTKKKQKRTSLVVPHENNRKVLRRIPIELTLDVYHPFYAKCWADHMDPSYMDDECKEADAYPLLDAKQKALVLKGLLNTHFHNYMWENVKFALEALRLYSLPRFDVHIELLKGKTLRCKCDILFYDMPYRLDAVDLRKELHVVLEHRNDGGGGYQGPRPKLGKEVDQWIKEGKDIWSMKYTVSDDGVFTIVPRSRYDKIKPANHLVTVDVYKPLSIIDKLLRREPEVAEKKQNKVTYPTLDGRIVYSSDITVAVHVRK